MAIKITSVKVVGICSKCRRPEDEIMRDNKGRIIPDENLACIGCDF